MLSGETVAARREQVRTIDRARLKEYIGRAGRATMQDVDHAIAVSFGLDRIHFKQDIQTVDREQKGALMDSRKWAWVYCSIDAPEDENEALKTQRHQLSAS